MKRLLSIKILGLMLVTVFLATGCPKSSSNAEKLSQLEKRVEVLEQKPGFPARQEPPEQTAAYQIPTGNSYVMGAPTASVSVVVFSDYQCPFCARTDPLMQEIIKDKSLDGKVNVVFKHFPLSFHNNAKPASKAALAAGEQGREKFWEMSAKLYENQQDLTAENFNKWAKEIGLNVTKFQADLKANDAKYDDMIKADVELGIKEAKVRGTPSIFVGGWELKERSVDGVKELIKDKKLL
ncbi:MAG: thioredoxin domain-containing protein [bacterium]|nr:thioredoxin domain-containing protein [bacterium]